MARIVRCGLIQAQCEWSPEKFSLGQIKEKMIAKHEKLIAAAAKSKVQSWACRNFSTDRTSAPNNSPSV